MAEAVVPEPKEPAAKSESLPRFAPQRAVHGGRFMIGYIVVIIMAAAALAAIAFMTTSDTSPTSAANWGRIAPESDGFQGARELAQEIARNYKGASGEQLAAIIREGTGRMPAFPDMGGRNIADLVEFLITGHDKGQDPAVTADPSWRTITVGALAHHIYAERAFDRLPILADALLDAGCASEDVLSHCRSDGPHVRGCWVLDLILGKG